ncbi:MAG: autotransporter-associated beta strand repeat-containing protein, partial [Candidatus Cloacimonetes bacterium]|nr:autotransporter-associated beta strand repeat-containing protein [Candidatus Cloacimonadota bacterium]
MALCHGWFYLAFNVPIVCPGGLSSELNAAGIIELTADNQITGNIVYNAPATFSVAKIGNRGSTGNNLGQGDRLIFNAAGRLLYTGTGETTDRYLELNHNVTLEHAGTGTLIFSEAPIMGGLDKTLTLSAAADATGGLLGAIGDGSQTTSLSKEGDGLWFLSAANNYSGATIINGGTMLLNGVAGAITTTPSIAVTNGALRVENSAGANNADRINNSASISLNNSAIQFAHDAGAFSVGETLGVVTVAGGVNTISLEPAGVGQSAILMLGGLSHISGTLNFAGQGLGESNGCRIFIAGQSEGVIGNAATVNGTAVAAYSNARGVYALAESEYTAELAAQGPAPDSLIPDDPSALASITMPGTSGPMTLAADWTNSVGLLLQNSAYDAVVALLDGATNKTLRTSALQIADGKADLTL